MQKSKQATVIYQGKRIELRHFRVYVYNKDAKLLVDNYNDYQNAIQSGEWFTTKAESLIEKPKVEDIAEVAEVAEVAVEAPAIEVEKVKLVAVSNLEAKVKANDANSKRIR